MTEAKLILLEDSNTFVLMTMAFSDSEAGGRFVRILKGGSEKETLVSVVQGLRDLASYIDLQIGDME